MPKREAEDDRLQIGAFRRIMDSDRTLRCEAVRVLRGVTEEESTLDGGRFVTFDEFMRFMDVALSRTGNVVEDTIKEARRLHMRVSSESMRLWFHATYVDNQYWGSSEPSDKKVRSANSAFTTQLDVDGSVWHNYVGSSESIEAVVQFAKEHMSIREEDIRSAFGQFLQVRFRCA